MTERTNNSTKFSNKLLLILHGQVSHYNECQILDSLKKQWHFLYFYFKNIFQTTEEVLCDVSETLHHYCSF